MQGAPFLPHQAVSRLIMGLEVDRADKGDCGGGGPPASDELSVTLQALAAARVAAAARSFSDSEAATETAAGGTMPRAFAEAAAADKRVRWTPHLRGLSSSSRNSSSSSRWGGSTGVRSQEHRGAPQGEGGGPPCLLPGGASCTEGGSSSAGEEAHRFRLRRRRRQQQQSEGAGSRKLGRHKQRRWLHQQLLVAVLRRLTFAGGESLREGEEGEAWGDMGSARQPSCWELLQADPFARDLYIRRKEGSLPHSPKQPSAQQAAADCLRARRLHCIRLMTRQQQRQQQQQQRREKGLRSASADPARSEALLRCAIASGSGDAIFPPASLGNATTEAATAAAGGGESGVCAALLAGELEKQRLLLLQVEGAELELLPSVHRMMVVHSAFRPLKRFKRDAATLFSLAAAFEAPLRSAYPAVAVGGPPLQQQLHGLLQQHAAAQPQGALLPARSSSNSCNSSSSSTVGVSSLRLTKGAEGPQVECMPSEAMSAEELQLLSLMKSLQQQQQAAAAGDWLVFWRLNGFERKVVHALVALTADLDSFSLSVSKLEAGRTHPSACSAARPQQQQRQHQQQRQQQQQWGSRRRRGAPNRDRALLISKKPNARVGVALPPVSLAAFDCMHATFSISLGLALSKQLMRQRKRETTTHLFQQEVSLSPPPFPLPFFLSSFAST
ncbi:hypothetical protein Esti_000254 [Eimeria stiedai]